MPLDGTDDCTPASAGSCRRPALFVLAAHPAFFSPIDERTLSVSSVAPTTSVQPSRVSSRSSSCVLSQNVTSASSQLIVAVRVIVEETDEVSHVPLCLRTASANFTLVSVSGSALSRNPGGRFEGSW